jgi:nucleotide-binding universal stress UspA family protein
MSIKTIAVLLSEPKLAPAVIDTAVQMGIEKGAHVIGLYGEIVDPPPIVSPFDLPDSTVISALYEAAQAKRVETEQLFNDAMSRNGVSAEWRSFRGSSGMAISGLVDSAHSVDLIITSQPAIGHVSDLDDVLFESGRPVLFIPWIDKEFKAFKRILIAWNGSRESARSVFDAMPFLEKANEVEVFTIDAKDTRGQSADFVGAEIASALARHGIRVTGRNQDSEGLPTASVIENRCSDFAADLLVMGAYSHARLRERIFGGVTQVLLESMTVPVLMSR